MATGILAHLARAWLVWSHGKEDAPAQASKGEMLLLCFVLCVLTVRLCSSQSNFTYYVTPNTSTKCPGGPCYNLTTYVQNSVKYFHSFSTFLFLPGVHYLGRETPAVFQDLVNVHLKAAEDCSLAPRSISTVAHQYGFEPYASDEGIHFYEPSVQIVCDSPSGLAFVNITNLTLHNLTILNCGSTFDLNMVQHCSVYMENITNLVVDGISIRNGTGLGLLSVDVWGDSAITRSSFVGNNQFVKNSIQKVQTDGLQCESKGTYYVNNLSLPLLGGNAQFEYRPLLPASVSNRLSFSSCLFALGVDGSINHGVDGVGGTGLNVRLIGANVTISDSTFYRNQAKSGANLYIFLSDPTSVIAIENVYSSKGIGLGSGFVIIGNGQRQSPGVSISHSRFECNSNLLGEKFISVIFGIVAIITGTTFNSSGINVTQIMDDTPIVFTFSDCNFINSDTKTTSAATYYGNCSFLSSKTYYFRASACFMDCKIVSSSSEVLYGTLRYSNCVLDESYIDALNSVLFLSDSFNCSNNIYILKYGGCIYLYASTIVFNPGANVTFSNNAAIKGGALYMTGVSYLNYTSPLSTTVSFLYNEAYISGGAIYVDQPYFSSNVNVMPLYCFYQFNASEDDVSRTSIAYFHGNTAIEGGSVLYGGNGPCLQYHSGLRTIGAEMYIRTEDFTSAVSSGPLYVCQCNTKHPFNISCSNAWLSRYVYPDQIIQLPLALADQNYSITPGVVLIFNTAIGSYSVIRTSAVCKLYTVPVSYEEGNPSSFDLIFGIDYDDVGTINRNALQLNVQVLPCPVGFYIGNKESPSCVCVPLLAWYGTICNISDQTILRSRNLWIGYVTNDTTILGIIDLCPYDYCKDELSVPISDFDYQCAYNRQKVLCGQCRSGMSMKFGTSQCEECSNYYLLLVIPFALMGVALVGILFLPNLTVTNGVLNGIILYANIVGINKTIFFPGIDTNGFTNFLSTFIAWLNLDFGIETCFYDGMDSYAKTWLQFVFPIYIFGLVGAIIAAGRCSSKISQLCKYNAVPVLATLVLLSYSKILRTIIDIFSFGTVDAGNASVPVVWRYDGNVEFFGLKHGILLAFGILVTLVLIVPYTIVLLFLPCLQSNSHWRTLRWVNKLKPFFDSYAGPFKDKYRFWSGVLILVRLPLYLLFAFIYDTTIRLVGIVAAVFLYTVLLCLLSVYKQWNRLILEGYFLMNLMAITVTKLIHPSLNTTNLAVSVIVHVGVGCAFLGFVAIVLAQVIVAAKVIHCRKKSSRVLETNEGKEELNNTPLCTAVNYTKLREPLLHECDV